MVLHMGHLGNAPHHDPLLMHCTCGRHSTLILHLAGRPLCRLCLAMSSVNALARAHALDLACVSAYALSWNSGVAMVYMPWPWHRDLWFARPAMFLGSNMVRVLSDIHAPTMRTPGMGVQAQPCRHDWANPWWHVATPKNQP